MRTRRYKHSKRKTNKRNKHTKTGKKWMTAIDAAQKTLSKTGSLSAAKVSLRKQALTNARRLFGSVGTL